MTDFIIIVAIVFALALVLALSLGGISSRADRAIEQARDDELRAREAVRTQHTVEAEPIRRTAGGWRT